MAKKEVQVTFRTVTPLWTGDAWQESKEIRPSSLIGSLRFWFETICYFSGICKDEDFNGDLGRFEKEVNREKFRKCINEKGNTFDSLINCLTRQNIPLPSIIFGTTNWKSLIEIKNINYLDDYCFGNKLNLPYRICINKNDNKDGAEQEIKENGDCPKNWSVFYFSNPYFYGKFQVTFRVEEEIIETIFYPLLNFMNKYGYWGGKWNIGYGRLKVEEVKVNGKNYNDWRKKEKFNKFIEVESDTFIEEVSNFNDLINGVKKVKFLLYKTNNNLKNIIKDLIKEKAKERANFNTSTEKRHKIFGKTGNSKKLPYVPQGSKILPFICEENGQYKGGFLSIAGLLNLEKASKSEGK